MTARSRHHLCQRPSSEIPPSRCVPGYTPTPEDLRLWEVYGDWVHQNPGTHLDGGISEDGRWQGWWRDLAVMPPRRYDASSGKVGRRFVNVLVRELRGMPDRKWNAERFIVFQTVTLQRARHVTASRDIRRQIEKRLDAWEAGAYKMLVEDTLRSSTQYRTAVRREESAEHRAKTFHGLVLRGKLRTAVRWITERETGGVLQPEGSCTKTGDRVVEVLHVKHPDARPSVSCKPGRLPGTTIRDGTGRHHGRRGVGGGRTPLRGSGARGD